MTAAPDRPPLLLTVDGRPVEVPDDGATLLSVLRDRLGLRAAKDGCSPQGQCGCCTVLVDGQPRVACVTPARRARGRVVTTLEGLEPAEQDRWGRAFCATGASQCGFCTPGIVVRLAALAGRGTPPEDTAAVEQALLAHLCRCTGWRTILDAWRAAATGGAAPPEDRDLAAAGHRATIEGRTPQRVGPDVALGHGGFADDVAPPDALVAVPGPAGGWVVGETLAEARAAAGKVQGRRTTAEVAHPLDVPEGDWDATLRTAWVEPAYLEPDASWCTPGGEPAPPLANGGAFGGKLASAAPAAARALAREHGRPVRVVLPREDVVRLGPKRPPVAGGMRADGSGVLRVARTAGVAEAVATAAPALVVEALDVSGPPTSLALRGSAWAEALVLAAGAGALTPAAAGRPGVLAVERDGAAGRARVTLRSPDGAVATADVAARPPARVAVTVSCGPPLDEVVLRSYCVGAAHMALGWVTSEGLAVDAAGDVHDLTIRSFGILRAVDTPPIDVVVEGGAPGAPPVNGSDAVFAAVAAATWLAQGAPPAWPTGLRLR
ncbi:MAG TPA: 2Fe-2S iron-sulfur cluster-binding protein [Acidimicrobiales bacterium]|nr:2Fe-2S iron-sulfur cluster-binding protein [Acidimicrobiales bacterium]